jgi:hypothetical protein
MCGLGWAALGCAADICNDALNIARAKGKNKRDKTTSASTVFLPATPYKMLLNTANRLRVDVSGCISAVGCLFWLCLGAVGAGQAICTDDDRIV